MFTIAPAAFCARLAHLDLLFFASRFLAIVAHSKQCLPIAVREYERRVRLKKVFYKSQNKKNTLEGGSKLALFRLATSKYDGKGQNGDFFYTTYFENGCFRTKFLSKDGYVASSGRFSEQFRNSSCIKQVAIENEDRSRQHAWFESGTEQ